MHKLKQLAILPSDDPTLSARGDSAAAACSKTSPETRWVRTCRNPGKVHDCRSASEYDLDFLISRAHYFLDVLMINTFAKCSKGVDEWIWLGTGLHEQLTEDSRSIVSPEDAGEVPSAMRSNPVHSHD